MNNGLGSSILRASRHVVGGVISFLSVFYFKVHLFLVVASLETCKETNFRVLLLPRCKLKQLKELECGTTETTFKDEARVGTLDRAFQKKQSTNGEQKLLKAKTSLQ